MRDNRGFTLIEMVFSFSIMMLLTVFSIPLVNMTLTPDLLSQANHLIVYVNYAKSYAINNRRRVELNFDKDSLEIRCQNELLEEYTLAKAHFSKDLCLWFNEAGNISRANTIYLKNSKDQVKLTFNLGTGNCYAK